MADDVLSLLKVHDYFRDLDDAVLAEVMAAGDVRTYAAADVIHEPDDRVDYVGFVLRGRLKIVRVDAQGRESLFRTIDRGGQIGLMLGALQEPVPVRVIALEPSVLLEIDYERGMELTLRYPALRRLWLKTHAGTVRKQAFGTVAARAPMVLAVVHEDPATRPHAVRLFDRLRGLGEALAVLGDGRETAGLPGVRYRSLVEDGRPLDDDTVRRQVAEWHDANRIVFELAADGPVAERVMGLADRIVYVAPASAGDRAAARLTAWRLGDRGWREKLNVAWVLDGGRTVAPVAPGLRDQPLRREFLLGDPPAGPRWGPALGGGLERLVHDLRDVRIGVALGGGAARGMSHLGVLRALDEAGIVVDMVAGTSAGAMSGVVYASGIEPMYGADCFARDLRPSWPFRRMPGGDHWYLLYKYRRGRFDPMLREYLHDWRLEQLAVPCLTVTVDLVQGTSVVRDHGDATHAILESINLPVLSLPIRREGKALVDGGLVNNIPADVLVARGCNFVIAVSVTAKMEHRFGGMTPDVPTARRKPSTLQTILRSLQVQNHSLNAIGVRPADVIIAPDVTGFDLTAFVRAKELAAIGEETTRGQVGDIRRLLHRLDPNLFPPAG